MTSTRNILAGAIVALVLAGCGGGNGNNGSAETPVDVPVPTEPAVTGPAGLVLLSDGSTLHAATVSAIGYTETGFAAIPPAGLASDHQIFGVVVHPNKKWVYTASASGSWGNARLSRFAIDWDNGALRHVDSTLMTVSGPACASRDDCAPVGLGIADNGTRLVVEDNADDTYVTYGIAADGALSYITEAALNITSSHGVGINSAGTYVYHGSKAYSRAGDLITALNNPGTEGNASVVLSIGGTEFLYTTIGTNEVAVLGLADPANPATIAALNPDPLGHSKNTLFMDVTKDGKRMLAVGTGSVAVVDFDGSALGVKYQSAVTGVARSAAFNADASLAVVSFQTGGAKLYTVAANGTLAEVGTVSSTNPTRAVVFATRP